MRSLLCLAFVFLILMTGCKRPDRTYNNNRDNEKNYSIRKEFEAEKSSRRTTPRTGKENIEATGKTTFKESRNLSDLYRELEKEIFMIYTVNGYEEVSQGSGFFIAPGIGVTNYHVLEDSEHALVAINKEGYNITEILASSHSDNLDYVIFRTDYRSNTPLTISDDLPLIGEDIFAIGSPQGLSNSLTKGTISGFREYDRIQIDATIDHGSSGGPLFNLQGEVIGITTSGMGTGSELNFAVNIQALPYKRFVEQ